MENKESNDRNLTNENVGVKNKLKDARKEGLTRGVWTTAIISLVLLLTLGVLVYVLFRRDHNNQLALMEVQKNSFTEQLTARDSTINDWLLTFDQIEKDLSTIKQKENIITLKSSDSEFTKDRKDQILEDIKYINTLLDANKKRIATLSAQLKASGGTIKGLQTRIESLEASLKLYETEIADLKQTLVDKDFEIGQLNTRMFALQDTISVQGEKISNQTGRLNQAFLAYGTFKDLKERGLVIKEGGFLGLGRKEFLIGDFSDSLFAVIDVTQTRTIPVNSRNAKLITDHPTNSYALIPDGENRIAYIEIKDPDQFWKISRYAVVELIK
jgi:predicted  nucleic acid-binding Zn-ribbon protein